MRRLEALFGNNLFVIFVIAAIAVISYANFKENQRMFLLYLLTYGTAFFGIFHIWVSAALLLGITFVFLEYLTEDTKKLELIVKVRYKLWDYGYMMVFQYHAFALAASFFLLWCAQKTAAAPLSGCWKALSVAALFWGEHLAIAQPFKIRSVTEIFKTFERFPIYEFAWDDAMQRRMDLLCVLEDRSYFQRNKSYSCFSAEYVRYYFSYHTWHDLAAHLKQLFHVPRSANFARLRRQLFRRGYSTPEMQLLRTLGIARGYDHYKVQRKIYEIVYSKLFFSSLRDYYAANTYSDLDHYRAYLLSIYFRTVLTKIKGIKCNPLASAFEKPDDLRNWSMEGLFIACLGLSFRSLSQGTLELYGDALVAYGLDSALILELNERFPSQKFPSAEERGEMGSEAEEKTLENAAL